MATIRNEGAVMEFCERNLGPTKGPDVICTGRLNVVESAAGDVVYGKICNTCGHALAKCEGYGKFIPDLKKHLSEKLREGMAWRLANPECLAKSPLARHHLAIESMAAKARQL